MLRPLSVMEPPQFPRHVARPVVGEEPPATAEAAPGQAWPVSWLETSDRKPQRDRLRNRILFVWMFQFNFSCQYYSIRII